MVEKELPKITNIQETEKLLESLQIPYYVLTNILQTIHHPPVKDVKDMLEKCKSDKGPLTYCKNLFIINKKTNEHLLIVAIHVEFLFELQDTEIDMKVMRKWLGAGSRDLRFGDKAILKEKIGATEVYSLIKNLGVSQSFRTRKRQSK